MDSELVNMMFGDVNFAYATYAAEKEEILITPVTSVWFKRVHEPSQFLLKDRNLKGDKSLALRELLLDNDLDTSDRELEAELIEKTNLLKVTLA